MTKRKALWFVRRATDNRILCVDRLWRSNAGSVDRIKFYTSAGRAHRYGLKGEDGTAYAVHHGDCVDCTGRVTRSQCTDGDGHSDSTGQPVGVTITDCEAFIGRDDTGGRYEGRTVYDNLADCYSRYDWEGLEDWLEYAESSDCDDPTIF
jgi:hypothetical protein